MLQLIPKILRNQLLEGKQILKSQLFCKEWKLNRSAACSLRFLLSSICTYFKRLNFSFFLWIDKKITKFKTFEKKSTNFTREINNTIFKPKKKQMFLDKKMASIKAEGL